MPKQEPPQPQYAPQPDPHAQYGPGTTTAEHAV